MKEALPGEVRLPAREPWCHESTWQKPPTWSTQEKGTAAISTEHRFFHAIRAVTLCWGGSLTQYFLLGTLSCIPWLPWVHSKSSIRKNNSYPYSPLCTRHSWLCHVISQHGLSDQKHVVLDTQHQIFVLSSQTWMFRCRHFHEQSSHLTVYISELR